MALHLRLLVTQGECQVSFKDTNTLLATTPLAILPSLDMLCDSPYIHGQALYAALGNEQLQTLLNQDTDGVLLLHCDEAASVIPWEYAATSEQRFVCCDYGMLRIVEGRPHSGGIVPQQLFVLCADPLIYDEDSFEGDQLPESPLEFTDELVSLKDAFLKSKTSISPQRLPPTIESLREALTTGSALVYFSGHGSAAQQEEKTASSQLWFEDACGHVAPLSDRDLLRYVPRGSLDTVLLNTSCSANVARACVVDGVRLAVGRHDQRDRQNARQIIPTFCRWLYGLNQNIAEAARQARIEIASEEPCAAGLMAVYVQEHTWQSLELPSGTPTIQLELPQTVSLPDAIRIPPVTGLLGRNKELVQIANAFEEDAPVVIIGGPGGMGKTALAAGFVERFGWRFPRVVGTSFAEASFDLARVCRELLEHFGSQQETRKLLSQDASTAEVIDRLQERKQKLEEKQAMLGIAADPSIEIEIQNIDEELAKNGNLDLQTQQAEQLQELLLQTVQHGDLIVCDSFERVLNSSQAFSQTVQAIKDLLLLLLERGARLLLTSRAHRSALPGEVLVPGNGLTGLAADAATTLFLEHSTRARGLPELTSTLLAQHVAEVTEGYPLVVMLLASSFDTSGDVPEHFLDSWTQHVAQSPNAAFAAAVEFSLSTLSQEQQEQLLKLAILPYPFVAEASVFLWGLMHDDSGVPNEQALEAARNTLAVFVERSLLQVNSFFPVEVRSEELLTSSSDEEDTENETKTNNEAGDEDSSDDSDIDASSSDSLTDRPESYRFHVALRQELLKRTANFNLQKERAAYAVWLARYALTMISQSPEIAQLVYQNLPILDAAAIHLNGDERLWHIQRVAWLRQQFGNLAKARTDLEETLKNIVEPSLVRCALQDTLADIYRAQDAYDLALRMYEDNKATYETLNYPARKAATLKDIASTYRDQEAFDDALRLYQESLTLYEALNDQDAKANVLYEMAYIYRVQGKMDEAMRMYIQSASS